MVVFRGANCGNGGFAAVSRDLGGARGTNFGVLGGFLTACSGYFGFGSVISAAVPGSILVWVCGVLTGGVIVGVTTSVPCTVIVG